MTTPNSPDTAGNKRPSSSPTSPRNGNDSVSSECSSSDDDSLVLEGVIERVVRDHDDRDSDSHADYSGTEQSNGKANKPVKKKQRRRHRQQADNSPASSSSSEDEDDVLQVEFTFCDMDEKYWPGLRSLLYASSTLYQPQASALADLMIANAAVGTLISTEHDDEDTVFGLASVLNVATHQDQPCLQALKTQCLMHCPADRKNELEIVWSGTTKRPAGLLLQARMINVPLQVVQVLHEQLVLDLDWAVHNAEGGQDAQKSFDFGVLLRLAPCQQEENGGGTEVVYKYFDDEILANRAQLQYCFDAPPAYSREEKQVVSVLMMSMNEYRLALQDLKRMIGKT